jgi:hypothetical protein
MDERRRAGVSLGRTALALAVVVAGQIWSPLLWLLVLAGGGTVIYGALRVLAEPAHRGPD